MTLKILPDGFSVCRLASGTKIDLTKEFSFAAHTDRELSLVCRTQDVPAGTEIREDGWRGFRIEGVLDFSLVGILSGISSVLAETGTGLFAVSTYDTDYIFVKEENLDRARLALQAAGYEFV